MCDGRSISARIELVCKRVEWLGVLAKVRDIENGFGIGQIEACKIGV